MWFWFSGQRYKQVGTLFTRHSWVRRDDVDRAHPRKPDGTQGYDGESGLGLRSSLNPIPINQTYFFNWLSTVWLIDWWFFNATSNVFKQYRMSVEWRNNPKLPWWVRRRTNKVDLFLFHTNQLINEKFKLSILNKYQMIDWCWKWHRWYYSCTISTNIIWFVFFSSNRWTIEQ